MMSFLQVYPNVVVYLRLLKAHRSWCELLLAEPSFFTVLDSYPIELIFPIREGRSSKQVGKKGRDKGRWSVGLKLCRLINNVGKIVAWDYDTMNVHDQQFLPLLEPFEGKTIVLADLGFRERDDPPDNLKLCPKGTWNERMMVETALSMVTVVCGLKRLHHRTHGYLKTHLAFVAARFNILLGLFHSLHPAAEPSQLSIAEFSL